MGHQGEAAFEGLLGVFELETAFAIGEAGEDLAEVAIHRVESLEEGLLAQGGHGFDPQQQLLPFLAEHVEPFLQVGQAHLQLLQFLQGEHVHRLERLHALLQVAELLLQGLQPGQSHLLGELGTGLGQLAGQLLQPQGRAAFLLG